LKTPVIQRKIGNKLLIPRKMIIQKRTTFLEVVHLELRLAMSSKSRTSVLSKKNELSDSTPSKGMNGQQ
jgi:hypothetical protein